MTSAKTIANGIRVPGSLSGSFALTKSFLRRHLWAWPLIAAAGLGAVGWWVNGSVESAMKEQTAVALTTILNADVTALKIWLGQAEGDASSMALDDIVRNAAKELTAVVASRPDPTSELLRSKSLARLRAELQPQIKALGYEDFFLVDLTQRVLASNQELVVGQQMTSDRGEFLEKVLSSGAARVSPPIPSSLRLLDSDGQLRAGVPTMFSAAPVKDDDGKPIAVIALRLRPDLGFTQILQVARAGKTGETYAIDRHGLLLSESRFDDDLKRIGLLPDRPHERSILTVEVRDPGVDMVEGVRPATRRSEQPLTRVAAGAISGKPGVDVEGYRDYRGVLSLGAWIWLPEHDFGVVTEVDIAEAFRPLFILRRVFRVLFGLLTLAAAMVFVSMLMLARQQRVLQRVTREARQLGQYTLEEKIGSGGMGSVYRARHAFLRRPTAVKLLNVQRISSTAVARFEREVQLTSQLSHPNTIAVFDYGRTADGIFYYAMEYLDGLDLEKLVNRFGPQPDARVAAILKQICGSLAEAHGVGLIHRDIKPANIILNRRGGLYDVVKVLDFGLVKDFASNNAGAVTSPDAMTGTPLYLSPEAIETPASIDPRSDLYAVGAVGYFLLSGSPVFPGSSVVEICIQHVKAPPEPPSQRLGRAISSELESLVLRCLEKDRDQRPASAQEIIETLDTFSIAPAWTRADAQAWWDQFGTISTREFGPPSDDRIVPPTLAPGQNTFAETIVAEPVPRA
jgi:eukaryotic-like serine/threonine-protein kinase